MIPRILIKDIFIILFCKVINADHLDVNAMNKKTGRK